MASLIEEGDGRCAVAFSGGADSTALLAAACEALGPERVLALHVDHGLQEASDRMAQACRSLCSALGAELSILKVDASAGPGESPEAAARGARYLALAKAALDAGCGRCLLGHHADDQAETLALALSRGLGLHGLSGMGEAFERHGARFERPFLGLGRDELRRACQERGLAWTEDPSNADPRFARNLVRAKAMPALAECFPHFARAAARSMAHCASAARLMDELGDLDLAANPAMELARLRELSPERLANLLMRWLKRDHGAHPSEAQVDEALSQVGASANRSNGIDIKCAHGRLRREGPRLRFEA